MTHHKILPASLMQSLDLEQSEHEGALHIELTAAWRLTGSKIWLLSNMHWA
jgi:hypothetical protein